MCKVERAMWGSSSSQMDKNVNDENKYSKTSTDATMFGGALKAFGSFIRTGDNKRLDILN